MTSENESGCCGCCSKVPLRLGLTLAILAFVSSIVALGTPMWFEFTYTNGETLDGYQGLWNHCYFDDDFACCGTVMKFLESRNITTPVWLQAVRAMMGTSAFFSVVSLIIVKCAGNENASKRQAIAAAIVTLITGLLHIASCIVYAVYVRDFKWPSRMSYSISFILAFVAGGCLLVTSLIILVAMCCRSPRSANANINLKG